jgi:putative copper export protein
LRNLLGPLRLFSLWGTYAVAVIAVSGTLNGMSILPSVDLLWRDRYGQLLSIKIALALGMMVLAAINRWRLLPVLASDNPAPARHLSRNIATESCLQ